ncbi:MAG: SLC13 family permease, partial [Gammaproteobacteria bacterium]
MTDTVEPAARKKRVVGLLLGIAIFVALLAAPAPADLAQPAWHVAAVAALLATLWLTEAIPVPATALLPIALFPLLGISSVAAATAPYANPIVFLFLGGFLIALAIERWNLHRRIALNVLLSVGSREDLQIGGFMIATAGLSMWVSNTATAVMMLPVALSIVPRGPNNEIDPARRRFSAALLLSVAYAANIGGVATLIGTPPNAFLR